MILWLKKITFIALLALAAVSPAWANEAASLDELLEMVREHALAENQGNKERERRFAQALEQQAEILHQSKLQRVAEEARSVQLETDFEQNEVLITQKHEQLDARLGSLKEMFGVLQQLAGELQGQFKSSLTSSQFADRGEFMGAFATKMGQTTEITTVEEIERVWFELMREMREGGKVVRFRSDVVRADGTIEEIEVVRVGLFNLLADGAYLDFNPDTQKIVELQRQPKRRYLGGTSGLIHAKKGDEPVMFGLDPAKGQLLKALVQSPNLRERIEQGGKVGYAILAVGAIALLIAIWRFIALTFVGVAIAKQLRSDQPNAMNPLGRVLKVYHDNQQVDNETIELKLGEAILKEVPSVNQFITILKIIAVVAPLMGLLGTVTGMINTFQAITLFGAGDPTLMASGISQALVTTVLGLVVAIPVTLLHSMVQSRAKRIVHILEEQSAGMVAVHRENKGGSA